MSAEDVKQDLEDISDVVSVHTEKGIDGTEYRVKLDSSVDDSSDVEREIRDKFGLSRIDLFKDNTGQLILRFA